jgi:hypothetical protein
MLSSAKRFMSYPLIGPTERIPSTAYAVVLVLAIDTVLTKYLEDIYLTDIYG